ncbi:Na+/H+ antiporter [Conexibacter stalactiti]|uniref:Na+/H+ antiporter n=1 Tax=Conexibacter stalactiti TaxID=1940611 RepID=A0ABU4HQT2_9ACTN|nr:Na+/H+ antiporter [Conexibacter stalactiti]MDW5595671.1 Na+/H+ antiporter [Conexibacter stalactiti]MEC5036313.1 Na+/H+ antiporter [Conexibacter stalactiti]
MPRLSQPIRDDLPILDAILIGLGGLLIILAVRVAADRTGMPAAVLFVLTGTVLSVLPGPTDHLDPDVVLELLIPPLLFAAALNASLLQIRSHLRLIASLSIGLVLATAVAVGVTLDLLVPGLGFAAALALGAAVAPPDPVAALAIGRRARMPERLTTLIEGEGLLNDATALTLYGIAVSAAVGGGFAAPEGVGRFLWAVAGGVAAGLAVAWAVRLVRTRVEDPLVQNALSLATPFGAFALAQSAEASGVLAVVVAGLWVGHQSSRIDTSETRLQTRSVWRLIEFLLEGYVFLLIGQQAPEVVDGLGEYATSTVLAAALGTVGVVLLVRPLWLLWLRRITRVSDGTTLSLREVVALSWAGTRGVITLATAFALPLDFPDRHLLLFCAYLVVLVTLVGQGLTFAPLLRSLRLRADENEERRVRAEARLASIEAGIQRLDELLADERVPPDVARRLRRAYISRRDRAAAGLRSLTDDDDEALDRVTAGVEALGRLRREMIDAERDELIRWRDAGRLPDASLRVLERELDYQEGSLPG